MKVYRLLALIHELLEEGSIDPNTEVIVSNNNLQSVEVEDDREDAVLVLDS